MAFRLTNLEVVKMLGAKVDAINERGIALLLWACVSGEFEIINSVLEKGSKVNAMDEIMA